MTDDIELIKEWSVDKQWYRFKDPRPLKMRQSSASRTIQGWWCYGADETLEIRFEDNPVRGWAIWLRQQRVDFVGETAPEPVLGDSIRAAKTRAVEWLGRETKTQT